jgi:DNA-binding MarR family transcriptional regulator
VTEVYAQPTTASDLLAATSGLRRALRRRVGRTGGIAELSEAQRELVRVVRRRPGIRVGEAAAELHLAANTVSTLVTGLCSSSWLRRQPDPEDGRSALLALTPEAEARVAEWRDRRQTILADALEALGPEDRDRIDGAIPALQRLVERLQETV